jgi:hypothetical protein
MNRDLLQEYEVKILSQIQEIITNPDCDNYINLTEEGADPTAFFHALANVAPAMLYNHVTAEDLDVLSFNHVANRLVHQYTKLKP